jgi:hypothetical protein
MSDFMKLYDAWRDESEAPYNGPLHPKPPPGNVHPTVGAMRTARQTREFMADGKQVRWHKEALPTQEDWQCGIFSVFSDGHRYIDGYPHIDDRKNALRVCNHDIRIPWPELGKDLKEVPIIVPFVAMTYKDAGFCTSCLGLTSAWDLMWQAAYRSWDIVEKYRRHWEKCSLNADRRDDDVSYSWPYRLFVRRDGSWRIVNLETDEIPSDALSWCGLISDAAKDTTYSLVKRINNLHAPSTEQSLIDAAVFSLPVIELTSPRFLEVEYHTLKGWALRNVRWDGGYLTAIAYAEQLDRIGLARGVCDSAAPMMVPRLLAAYEDAAARSGAAHR